VLISTTIKKSFLFLPSIGSSGDLAIGSSAYLEISSSVLGSKWR
jgi:hypothetical protein